MEIYSDSDNHRVLVNFGTGTYRVLNAVGLTGEQATSAGDLVWTDEDGTVEDIRRRSFDEGYNVGHSIGRDEGYDAGFDVGRRQGHADGFSEGHADGLHAGLASRHPAGRHREAS